MTIITAENGSRRNAAPSGLQPMTPWKYWASMKNEPNMAKNTSVMPPDETANRGFWNSRSSSIGWRLRHSHSPKATRKVVCGAEPQRRLGAQPAMVRTFDDGVDEGAETEDREHRADRVERGLAGILRLGHEHVTGDDRRGDDRQVDEEHRAVPEVVEQQSRRRRVRSPRPAPEMPAQMAIALARSRAGKTLARIDSVEGMTNAAPTPMMAREAISMPGACRRTRRAASRARRSRGRPAVRPCDRSGRRGRRP